MAIEKDPEDPRKGKGPQKPPPTLPYEPAPPAQEPRRPPVVGMRPEGAREKPRETLVEGAEAAIDRGPEKVSIDSTAWRVGDVILNLYEVTAVLGEGGMGTVYKVQHRGWNVALAVKTPRPEILATEKGFQAVEREAETWVNLGLHPHIVSCYYVRRVAGIPRVFAEFVDGGNLHDRIQREEGASLDAVLDLAIQAAWGLHYAHQHGVIHLDVKPSNILVTNDGVAKVSDFGLARAVAAAGLGAELSPDASASVLVSTGGLTLAYCSPEQYAREPLTLATDIWSFAVSLLEMLLGETTWSLGIAAPQVLEDRRKMGKLSNRFPRVPESLVRLLQTCFQKEPSRRPASLQEVARSLSEIYREVTGHPYTRRQPAADRNPAGDMNNRAVSLVDLGRTAEAVQLWRKALERDVHHVEATYNQCLYGWRSGTASDEEVVRPVEILARTEEIRQNEFLRVHCSHLLGRIHLVLGDYAEAQSCLEKAVSAGAAEAQVARDLGIALSFLARKKNDPQLWQAARDSFRKALEEEQADPYIVAGYALALLELGEAAEAVHFYEDWRGRMRELPPGSRDAAEKYLPGFEIVLSWQGASGPVQSACLSADSRYAAAVGDGHTVRSWTLETGEPLSQIYESGQTMGAFALSADGRHAVLAFEGQPLQLWDIRERKRVGPFQRHQGKIACIAVSRTGEVVVAGATDRLVRAWKVPSGEKSQAFPLVNELAGHSGAVSAVAVSPDGRYILSGSRDQTLRFWNRETGACLSEIRGHSGTVTAVDISRDARLALSGHEDSSIRLRDLSTGACIRTLRGHTQSIVAVRFAPERRAALSASADGTLRAWNLDTGLPSVVARFEEPIGACDMSGDGEIALVAHGNTLSLVKAFVREPMQMPFAMSRPVSATELEAFSAEFRRKLAQAGTLVENRQFREAMEALREARSVQGYERSEEGLSLWRQISSRFPRQSLRGAWEAETCEEHGSGVTSLSLSDDGLLALAGCGDGSFHVRKLRCDEHPVIVSAHKGGVSAVAFRRGSTQTVTGAGDGSICVWVPETGERRLSLVGHEDRIEALRPLADGRHLLSASADKNLILWDLETGGRVRVFSGHEGAVTSCDVSPDGCYAVSGSTDRSMWLWDVREGNSLRIFEKHALSVLAVSISPDGLFAASAGEDWTVCYWDLRSGVCLRTFAGHSGPVTTVAFSPDGRFLASGGADKSVRLWDIRANKCLRVFEGHTGPVTSVAFDPDGDRLVSGSKDDTLRVWYLDWEPGLRDEADWDEKARPYLEFFLSRRAKDVSPTATAAEPEITKDDFRILFEDLRRRGFGWIRRKGIRKTLGTLTAGWNGETSAWQTIKAASQKQTGRIEARAEDSIVLRRRKKTHRKWLRWISLAVLGVAAFLVWSYLTNRVTLDEKKVEEVRRGIESSKVARNPSDELRKHSEAGAPHNWSGLVYETMEAGPPSEDLAFTLCTLGTDEVVGPLMEKLRERRDAVEALEKRPYNEVEDQIYDARAREKWAYQLTFTVLTELGEKVTGTLPQYLKDSNTAVRKVAAASLAAQGTRRAVESLLEAANSEDSRVRLEVAKVLRELTAGPNIQPQEALDLAVRLCRDRNPEVRKAGLLALPMFRSLKAGAIAKELTKDQDPQIRQEADRILQEMPNIIE